MKIAGNGPASPDLSSGRQGGRDRSHHKVKL